MVGRTDGWMDGWLDGRMDGWTDGRMDGRIDGWMAVGALQPWVILPAFWPL